MSTRRFYVTTVILMAILAGLLFITGCAFEPDEATPFDPPAAFRALWSDAQACSGRTGAYTELRFFTVPGETFPSPEGEQSLGWNEGTTIYLAEVYATNPLVVKHEMIHALGVHGHPAVPFENPCRATFDSYQPAQ